MRKWKFGIDIHDSHPAHCFKAVLPLLWYLLGSSYYFYNCWSFHSRVCISQGSAEKDKQGVYVGGWAHGERERERDVLLRNWLTQLQNLGGSQSEGVGKAGCRLREELQFESKDRIISFLQVSLCSVQAFNWLLEAHPHYGG